MKMMNIAVSGLNASMAALNTVTNNTVNALTPGYSRQEVLLSSVGGAYGGNGVQVDGIQRISSTYQVAQLRQATSQLAYAEEKQAYLGSIEQFFAAEGNSITGGLDNLFAALNGAQEQPNEIAHRQAILNEANNLANRFSNINDAMYAQQKQLEGQVDSSITEINGLIENLANVNKAMVGFSSPADIPPTLLDERDATLQDLAKLIDINVVEDSNGLVNVSLPQGQPLVTGTSHGAMTQIKDPADPYSSVVKIEFAGAEFPLRGDEGGQLGALIEYRGTTLKESKAYMDELAVNIADDMNAILAGGTDLNGNAPTKPLFTYNPLDPSGTLAFNKDLKPDELALGKDGTPGDNSNLKELIALADKEYTFASLGGANVTMGESYVTKVGQLGSESRQAQLYASASSSLAVDAKNQWASTSGVNMDEEGVNLIMYQQAYSANAKVISTADQLFQTLLGSFR